jgi:hypothetical protein
VEATATKSTVETAEPTAAVEGHGWRCHGDCRRHYGRGKAPEQFSLHELILCRRFPNFLQLTKICSPY